MSLVLGLLVSLGCESKAGNGALIGAAGGALVGGVIGNNVGNGHTLGGAAIGAGAGAIGGALVGHAMDENDKKEREARYTNKYDDNFDQYGNRR